MAEVVFLLCAMTSAGCSLLLIRGYRESRARLLLWSSLAFVGLAINNVLLVIDKLIVPNYDMYEVRLLSAFLSVGILAFGLIWDSE